MIPLQLQLLGTFLLVCFLGWVLWLIRSERLTLRDSLVWLLTTLAALAIAIYPEMLGSISHLLGIQIPSNALFAAAVFYLSLNVLTGTIALSQNSSRVVRLSQECALLRAELESLKARLPSEELKRREHV